MTKTTKGIALSFAVGALVYLLAFSVFSFTQASLLGVIAMLVVLWSNEAIPIGVTSLLPILLFPALSIATTNDVTPNYAKSIIFLFLGGFMLAIAVEKTGLHKIIAHKMLAIFPNTVRGMIFALAITSGVLSSFLSNTTTTLLLIPLALFLSEDANLKMRFALAIAYGASIGGIITPIGTPPNLILYGIMEDKGLEILPFMQWVIMTFPLALLMFFVVASILSLGTGTQTLELKEKLGATTPAQKKVLYALIGLVILLFANSPIKPYYDGLGLNEKGILLGFGLLMFLPPFSILTWEDSKKIPYQIIFLFGAGFSIAMAFTKTGLAAEVASYLSQLSSLPPLILLIIIAAMVTFTTEVTSNTALISMLLPVIYEVTIQNGLDVNLFMMVATLCASYAFMLPIATPPNAIAMSSGVVDVKTMARYGVIFNLVGIGLIVFIAQTYWPLFS
jgi:sodium-dependent dicarboxylate transporter 2/3/5